MRKNEMFSFTRDVFGTCVHITQLLLLSYHCREEKNFLNELRSTYFRLLFNDVRCNNIWNEFESFCNLITECDRFVVYSKGGEKNSGPETLSRCWLSLRIVCQCRIDWIWLCVLITQYATVRLKFHYYTINSSLFRSASGRATHFMIIFLCYSYSLA